MLQDYHSHHSGWRFSRRTQSLINSRAALKVQISPARPWPKALKRTPPWRTWICRKTKSVLRGQRLGVWWGWSAKKGSASLWAPRICSLRARAFYSLWSPPCERLCSACRSACKDLASVWNYMMTSHRRGCNGSTPSWRFISDKDQSWQWLFVAGTVFGDVGGWHLLLTNRTTVTRCACWFLKAYGRCRYCLFQ